LLELVAEVMILGMSPRNFRVGDLRTPMVRAPIFYQAALSILVGALLAGAAIGQVHEKVIHTFLGPEGDYPTGNLIFDSAGNIYGTAGDGGANGYGTVYELSPSGAGGWTLTVLYSFAGGTDGNGPNGVVMDGLGNLYGTTYSGGTYGLGTAYELTPSGQGAWSESVLYSFGAYAGDGTRPSTGLVLDTAGNLYGTTRYGGPNGNCTFGCGIAFELSRSTGGQWNEAIIYGFLGLDDGYSPSGGLIFGQDGGLYGTTLAGGAGCSPIGCGTVFELKPSQSGAWIKTVIKTFESYQGAGPVGGVVFDSLGHLYGATEEGGELCGNATGGCGTVFELTPKESGNWSLANLHKFGGSPVGDGAIPDSGVVLDRFGNIYGTTSAGGALNNYGFGTVFELQRSSGHISEMVFGDFGEADGQYPTTSVALDKAGRVYSTTVYGGVNNGGVVFELTK
jgi:uncharacterized repeat protein (TIGR03803 family)